MPDATAPPVCVEPGCTNPRKPSNRERTRFRPRCGLCDRKRYPEDAEKAKARQRRKTHHRKAVGRQSDVSLNYEVELRRKARHCPLCKVLMTSKPYLPHSKELDHMIPLNVGGTHTVGNVRVICRTCNIARPKDGSDYGGPVTLWAQVPGFVQQEIAKRGPALCQCGATKRKGRCWTCQPSRDRRYVDIHGNPLTDEIRRERGRKAAALRAECLPWSLIATTLGFGGTGSAYSAARQWGDQADQDRWPTDSTPWLRQTQRHPA